MAKATIDSCLRALQALFSLSVNGLPLACTWQAEFVFLSHKTCAYVVEVEICKGP